MRNRFGRKKLSGSKGFMFGCTKEYREEEEHECVHMFVLKSN